MPLSRLLKLSSFMSKDKVPAKWNRNKIMCHGSPSNFDKWRVRHNLLAEQGCLPCPPLKIKKSVLLWGKNVLIVFHYELKLSIKIAIFQKAFPYLGNPWLSPWWRHFTNVGPTKTEMWRKYTEYKNENQLLESKCLQIDSGFQRLHKKTF